MIVDPPAGCPADRIEPTTPATKVVTDDRRRVLDAMRSGEWLRTQWIARVAFDLGTTKWHPDYGTRVLLVLRHLHSEGTVERRDVRELKRGEVGGVRVEFYVPRSEWRLTPTSPARAE